MPEEAENIILKGQEFLVTTHLNPDGDAVGSLLGLSLALQFLGKEVKLICPHPVPSIYQFLPGTEFVQSPKTLEKKSFEVGIILDCTELERTGKDLVPVLKLCKNLVNIDHHVSNKIFGTVNFVDPEAAATGELICEILETIKVPISPEVASNLYVALLTDTGSFQFTNTTPRSHRTAARLLEYGAAQEQIQQFIFEHRSLTSLNLLEKSLSTLSISKNRKVAWMTIPQKFFLDVGGKIEDCEGFINYPKSLAGVEVGILFKELDSNEIKVSFRSKNFVDVNRLATFFGGGGHERAAGCTIWGHLKEVESKVVKITEIFLERYQLRS